MEWETARNKTSLQSISMGSPPIALTSSHEMKREKGSSYTHVDRDDGSSCYSLPTL